MPDARALYLTVSVTETTTAFQLQFSTDGATWTDFSRLDDTPDDPETIDVSELDAESAFLLDGLNSPTGNAATASQTGTFYRVRLLESVTKGNWSDPLSIDGYPGAAELRAFLEAAGLTVSTALALRLPGAIAAARREFETATGRRFLAGGEETRRFDPPTGPTGRLIIGGRDDLASTPTVVYQPEGSDPTTLVLGTDYVLEPVNAPQLPDPQPFTCIRFTRRWGAGCWGAAQSIRITGRFGYGNSVPDDVQDAILGRAAAGLVGTLRLAAGGGKPVERWTDVDGVSQTYGTAGWDALKAGWDEDFRGAVARYRWMSL